MRAAKRKAKPVHRTPARKIAPRAVSPGTAIVARPPARPEPIKVAEAIEKLLIDGNLAPLSAENRLEYYNAVCRSLGLNPLTKPFAYIQLNGKTVLYALRDCTDQLRKVHGISVTESKRSIEDGLCVVEVKVCNREGRTDTGTGAVLIDGTKGESRANVIMKAETKAKRRATLSICGLGMLDECELDTMRGNFQMLTPAGRVIDEQNQVSEHEQRYLDREAEALKKLTPAQREVVETKMAAAKAPQVDRSKPAEEHGAASARTAEAVPCLFYRWFNQSQTARIEPQPNLKLTADLKALVAKKWNGAENAAIFNGEELEALKFEFEKRGVPVRRLNGNT